MQTGRFHCEESGGLRGTIKLASFHWDPSSACRQRAEWSPAPIKSVLLQIHTGTTVAPWEPAHSRASSAGASVACSYLSPGLVMEFKDPI